MTKEKRARLYANRRTRERVRKEVLKEALNHIESAYKNANDCSDCIEGEPSCRTHSPIAIIINLIAGKVVVKSISL